MNLPVKLYFKAQLIGEITSCSYETPWASGRVSIKDSELFQKLVSVSQFMDFSTELESRELTEEQEDAEWENMLKELGLSYEDLKIVDDENWKLKEGWVTKKEMRAVSFDKQGFIQWRP